MQVYVVGTAHSVLIREVSFIQGVLYREVPLYTKLKHPAIKLLLIPHTYVYSQDQLIRCLVSLCDISAVVMCLTWFHIVPSCRAFVLTLTLTSPIWWRF